MDHRFKIDLTLAKLSLTSTADSSFVELFRLKSGKLQNKKNRCKNINRRYFSKKNF